MQKQVTQESACTFLAHRLKATGTCLHVLVGYNLCEKKIAEQFSYVTTFTSPSSSAVRCPTPEGRRDGSSAVRCHPEGGERNALANLIRNGGGSCAR